MLSRFTIASLFRLTTLCVLACLWRLTVQPGAPGRAAFAIFVLTGAPLTAIVVARRRGKLREKVLLGVFFALGWLFLTGFVGSASLAFRPSVAEAST